MNQGLARKLCASLAFSVVAAMAISAHAQTPNGAIFTHRYNHIVQGQYSHYVDFSAVSANSTHLSYKTFTSPDSGTGVVKFLDIQNHTLGVARCLEYRTFKATPSSHPDADFKLWANVGTTSSPIWTKLADDTTGLHPRARVFVSGSVTEQPVRVRLAAYSEVHNGEAAWLQVFDLGTTSQSSCESGTPTGAGILRVIDGSATLVRAGN